MSRKQRLTETLNQYLQYDNQGTPKNCQTRRIVLNKLIEDFYRADVIPAHWHDLTQRHLEALIAFWRKKGIQDGTIMNYMVCLRAFFKAINHPLQHLNNSALTLSKPRAAAKPAINAEDILNTINEPIAYVLFALQTKFGLTFKESIVLTPDIHLFEKELWVTREISSNHKDRFIPITLQTQLDIIAKVKRLMGDEPNLVSRFGEKHLRLAWQFTLSSLNLPTHINYYYLYLKPRFRQLNVEYSQRESKKRLLAETCINKTNPIWKTLHE